MGKRTKWKKALSLLLVLSMMFSLFSINAFAAEPEDADYVPEEPAVEEVVTETGETEPEVPEVPEQPEEPEVTEPETPEVPAETEETEPEVPAGTEDETAEPEEPAEAEDAEEAEEIIAADASVFAAVRPGTGIGGGITIDPGDGLIVIKPITCKHINKTYSINADGTHTSVCNDCNKTVEKNQPHNMTYTMNEDGTHTGVCESCADEETEEHTMEWVVTKEATFEEPGEKVLTCSVCGFEGETEVINALTPVAEVNGQQYASLQEALDAVKAQYGNDADPQTEWTVQLVSNTVECVKITPVATTTKAMTLTIDLNGKTITGNGSGPVITVGEYGGMNASVQFIIADSVGTGVVTGGTGYLQYGSTYGGAIYVCKANNNSKLIINGGNFTGNTATYGGVISSHYQEDVPVIIYGGTFSGNTATLGGAVYARTLTVNGGIFTGNTAAQGGAIHVVGGGTTANLSISDASVYGNTATEYGADIVFGLSGSYPRETKLNLMDPSAMGIVDIDTWLVDGYGLDGATDRASDTNRVDFIAARWPNTNNVYPAVIGLKAGLGHTHTPGEPVEENRVEATYEAPGSYDLVTKCEICDKEMNRETVEIAQLVPAPVIPVAPTNPGSGSSAAGSTTTPAPTENPDNGDDAPAAPAAPTTPEDPEPEDDDDVVDEQDIPMAAPEATPEAAPEADDEAVTIDEEDTPLATIGESNSAAWSLLNLVLALVTVLMSLMMLASYFKAKSNLNLVSIIPAVFAVVTFMVTSSLSGSMVFADSWTPAMLLYAALNAGVVAFAMKKRKESAK